ncbi:MAG: guanylate kinase [Clostridia bacterium]|nr:guanylate kinase [Clostridia bacterium]
MHGQLLVVSGPSGSGKGTVVEFLKKTPGYDFSVSVTTRAPRVGEVEGVNYYYITNERFEELKQAGELLEFTSFCGTSYGTPVSEIKKAEKLDRALVFDIETEGAANVKRLRPEAILVMLIPPTFQELERRLRGRKSESEEKIANRLAKAKQEILLFGNYDYIVVNETGGQEEAAKVLDAIVRAKICLAAGGPKNKADEELLAFVSKFETKSHPDVVEKFFCN